MLLFLVEIFFFGTSLVQLSVLGCTSFQCIYYLSGEKGCIFNCKGSYFLLMLTSITPKDISYATEKTPKDSVSTWHQLTFLFAESWLKYTSN